MRPLTLPTLIFVALIAAGCANSSDTPTSPRLTPAASSRSGAPPAVIPVTTTVYDADATGNLLLTRSDDYNGTGVATYATVGKLTSHVSTSGGWQLYLGSQTARTIYLVLASQGIPAPDGKYAADVEVYSGCFDQNDAPLAILLMTAGASNGNCNFGVDFSSGRTKYKLAMGPTNSGTGRATVTCNAAANGNCTNWTIAPNPAVANAGVANLYHYANNGGLIFDGVHQNSYSVTVAR
jgi:hypothetical protein